MDLRLRLESGGESFQRQSICRLQYLVFGAMIVVKHDSDRTSDCEVDVSNLNCTQQKELLVHPQNGGLEIKHLTIRLTIQQPTNYRNDSYKTNLAFNLQFLTRASILILLHSFMVLVRIVLIEHFKSGRKQQYQR